MNWLLPEKYEGKQITINAKSCKEGAILLATSFLDSAKVFWFRRDNYHIHGRLY